MGCGSAKGAKDKPSDAQDSQVTEASVSNPPVATAQLWASSPSAGSNAGKLANSSPSGAKKDGRNMLVQDADDDDDEIEIIYEAGPKKTGSQLREDQRSAANGQEPPDAVEPDMRPKRAFEAFGADPKRKSPSPVQAVEKKPLSKEQQEEAAKLAERRAKFDEKRYQKDSSSADLTTAKREDFIKAQAATPVGRESPQPFFHKPKQSTDMVMGLNQAPVQRDSWVTSQSQPDSFAGLPGGIFDEVETIRTAPGKKKQQHHHNDEEESLGFDADDEKLMTEILEDFDL